MASISLDEEINNSLLKHADGDPFTQKELLMRIMTKESVIAKLKEYKSQSLESKELNDGKSISASTDVDDLWLQISGGRSGNEDQYFLTFALLLSVKHGDEICNFISCQVKDSELPPEITDDKTYILANKQSKPFDCFKDWQPSERKEFVDNFWRYTAYRFSPDEKHGRPVPRNCSLDRQIVLPWSKMGKAERRGGYSQTAECNIDSSCHDFERFRCFSILRDSNHELTGGVFVLKTLNENSFTSVEKMKEAYDNEVKQLVRFSGTRHENLVTLLASFEHKGTYNLLFPKAEGNLKQYMKDQCFKGTHTMAWLSTQLYGLISATSAIHNPGSEDNEKFYGRHSDLKPENILRYKCNNDPQGILVISDMGHTVSHEDRNLCDVPKSNVERTPEYHPPEFMMKDGRVNQSSDIWMLGCVFLEMVIWSFLRHGSLYEFKKELGAKEDGSNAITRVYYKSGDPKGDPDKPFVVNPAVSSVSPILPCFVVLTKI